MKNYVVYKITNKINNKIYIGVTNNTRLRWSGNGTQYRDPSKEGNRRPFWSAIKKYGWDNFEKEILINNLSKEEAYKQEIQMIKMFNSTNKNIGYNLSPGGNGGVIYKEHPKGMLGKSHSIENNIRQKLFMSDKSNNPMYNGKTIWGVTHPHPKGMKGKKHSEEKRRQISETLKRKGHAQKKVEAILPDGEIITFESLNDCADYFGVMSGSSFIRNLLKTNQPYKMHPNTTRNREKLKLLEGLTLKYLDNTEVTNDSKIS